MSLAEYRRKRRFDKTREPEPGEPVQAGADAPAIFVVQLHHASNRHYDFRLQVGDALKSWAVPKGPSLDPKVKRLAAEVEDHPVSYATFEGEIPAGQYGAGHVAIFDSGAWRTDGDPQAQLEKGHLTFELFGTRLKGGWHLVRSGRPSRQPQWLLFKKRDDFAATGVEADDLLTQPPADANATAADRETPASEKPESIADATPTAPPPPATADSSTAEDRPAGGARSRGRIAATRAAPGSTLQAAAGSAGAAGAAAQAGSPARQRGTGRNAWRKVAGALSGSRTAPLDFDAISLQLARLVDEPPSGEEWLHEPKWDGYRILALVQDGKVSLWSRNRLAWTHKLPDIVAAIRALGLRDALLDGELIAGQGAQKDFGLLQATLSGEKQGALAYMLFDILHVDGIDIAGAPLSARKELLEAILKRAPRPLFYSSHVVGRGQAVFKAATAQGLEGIVSKRADAPHRSGRSDDWLKSKEPTSDEFAVVGFTPPKGARSGFGALLLARPDPEHGWRYTGRLGTGFSNSQLTELLGQLDRDTRPTPTVHVPPHDTDLRGARWIEPAVVVEAFYRGVGKEGLLRQPSLKAIRVDKRVEDLLDPDRDQDQEADAVKESAARTPAESAARTPAKKARAGKSAPDAATGEEVRLTHPERVVFPDRGITKGDVADYYVAVMPWLLPEIINRPVSIIRCTQGIDKACFFQKHATAGLSRVDTVPIREESGEDADYLVVRNPESLLELVQFNALEFHTWGATAEQPDIADRLVFDLDPGPDVSWSQLVAAARRIRELLEEVSLVSFLKSSGGKGLHVVVPLNPGADWTTAKAFARELAESLAAREPSRYVASASKALRTGRVFVDYLRNGRGATSVASWSLRSRPGAPAAVPLGWEELDRLKRPDAFDIASVPRRLAGLKTDPWAGFDDLRQDLAAAAKSLTGTDH